MVEYPAPVWVVLYVVARGQQKLSLQKVGAVGCALAGTALVIGLIGAEQNAGPASRLDSYGLIAAGLAAFSFAFYNVGGHSILGRYDRWRGLIWTFVSASTLWILLSPPWHIA